MLLLLLLLVSYSAVVATGATELQCYCCYGCYCATVLPLLLLLLVILATVLLLLLATVLLLLLVLLSYSTLVTACAPVLLVPISYWALLCYWCYCAAGTKVLPPLLCNGCYCAIMQLSYFATYATLLLDGTCFGVAIESTYFFACTFQVTRKLIPLPCLVLAICTFNIVAPNAPVCMSFSIQRIFSTALLSYSLPVLFI